jgi:hypothetical protein
VILLSQYCRTIPGGKASSQPVGGREPFLSPPREGGARGVGQAAMACEWKTTPSFSPPCEGGARRVTRQQWRANGKRPRRAPELSPPLVKGGPGGVGQAAMACEWRATSTCRPPTEAVETNVAVFAGRKTLGCPRCSAHPPCPPFTRGGKKSEALPRRRNTYGMKAAVLLQQPSIATGRASRRATAPYTVILFLCNRFLVSLERTP